MLDDAYMYVRYAANLLDGKGVAWNPDGVQTYGVTSLPYLLAVAVFSALGLPKDFLLVLLSWMFGALSFATVVFACRTAVKTRSLESLPVLIVLCCGPVAWRLTTRTHALGGMDTTMSAFGNALLLLSVMAVVTRQTQARFRLMCLAAYASYAIRPDNALYALLVPLLGLVLLTPRRTDALKFLLVFGGLVALDLTAKRAIFGYAFPLSAYVKQTGYYTGYAGARIWNPITYLGEFSWLIVGHITVLIVFARRRHARLLAVLLGPVVATFLYYFTVIQIMGMGARFYYPAFPFWIASAVLVLDDVLDHGFVPRLKTFASRGVILGVFLGLLNATPRLANRYAATVWGPPVDLGLSNRRLPQIGIRRARQEVGTFAAALPSGTLLAATEVGFLGVAAPQVTRIDLAGLNDNNLARYGFSMSYLLGRRPDVIWLPHWHYVDMVHTILATDAFQREFDYYCEAFDFGVAVRKDGRFHDVIMSGLNRTWKEIYAGLPVRACEYVK
jgi:hypothetical protein